MKKEKVFRKITIGFLSLILMGLFTMVTSCSNDDEVEQEMKHTWYYKVEASAGSNIVNIVHENPDRHAEEDLSITKISGTTYTSGEFAEKTMGIPGNYNLHMYIKAKAAGKDASSTLKVQIYVDGVLVKEVKDSGEILSAEAIYDYGY